MDRWNGHKDGLLLSVLQGYMGRLFESEERKSSIAMIGDFAYLGGKEDLGLWEYAKDARFFIPVSEAWEKFLCDLSFTSFTRYAMDTPSYDIRKLSRLAYVDMPFALKEIDEETHHLALEEPWSRSLCSQFKDYDDYRERGFGIAILHWGKLVSAVSPYAVYDGGVEIEIATHPDYRGMGLATAAGASFLLLCITKSIIPHWDAHNQRSVHLAEKLGYKVNHPYTAYKKQVAP